MKAKTLEHGPAYHWREGNNKAAAHLMGVDQAVLEEVENALNLREFFAFLDRVEEGDDFWDAVSSAATGKSEELKERYQLGWKPTDRRQSPAKFDHEVVRVELNNGEYRKVR